ncbi:SURF1 family protein [Candidatus Trichorickettsia mobilis]|uniref:SURF1-like protein n=1 Tax=Candidatus Trichorickettsia mobilis TaxID=1346319 RepID=A0ABZ0URD9_9RICK|nr:SURF1 family protein [Candidatus Trichorickettsia mobilis]WPY00381.1 SURF1 family protein [Candidatus Trichorickettsia mobilis]
MKLQKSIKLLPLLFTVIAVSILLSLGFWQLQRLQDKNLLIKNINYNLNNKPLDIQVMNQANIYSKINIHGKFLTNHDIHLYRRIASQHGQDGYYLLSPFQTNNNQLILVARGWFKSIYKPDISKGFSSKQEQISGIVLTGEQKQFFIPGNDLKNNIWFILDLNQIAQFLKLELPEFYLLQLEPDNLPDFVKPIPADNLTKIKNDHLEYAFTWFILAISLIIIFIIYVRKESN